MKTMSRTLPIVSPTTRSSTAPAIPDGLSGDQFSLPVRIVTVSDVFDALTTERAYRAALRTRYGSRDPARRGSPRAGGTETPSASSRRPWTRWAFSAGVDPMPPDPFPSAENLLSRVAARAAHDLNNALAILSGHLYLLGAAAESPEEAHAAMEKAAEQIGRLSKSLEQLGAIGRGETESFDWNDLAREAAEAPIPGAGPIELELGSGLPAARGRRADIRRALDCLLANAREASVPGGADSHRDLGPPRGRRPARGGGFRSGRPAGESGAPLCASLLDARRERPRHRPDDRRGRGRRSRRHLRFRATPGGWHPVHAPLPVGISRALESSRQSKAIVTG